MTALDGKDKQTVRPYSHALMSSLVRIVGEWSAPDFLTAVVAREGLELGRLITVITLLSTGVARRPSKLAQQMVTGASNMSKILARLSTAGIVERVPDPVDARASLVTLTPDGRAVANSFVQAGDSLVAELLNDWEQQDRQDLVRLLDKLEHSTTKLSHHLRTTSIQPTPPTPEHSKGEQS
ncbi:MarR family winged helix-turn-helix transcriptional regulator [Arthrobacter psychrolactophilus]